MTVPILPVVYDLSFIRFPNSHPKDRIREMEKLPKLLSSTKFIHTISEFSKREIIDVFGCSPNSIFVAPPAASEIYRPLGEEVTQHDIRKYDLATHRYLLTVGTLEPRKNLRTIIAAYARLTASERSKTPLVVVGHKGWGNLQLPTETDRLFQEGSLRFLGAVSDDELRSLYEGALGLLFPSVYEGFGMPVVEALACGARVVHAANSAMEEASGGLAIHVEANDVVQWTNAILDLIEDENVAEGRDARLRQASAFNWGASATIVADVYDKMGQSL